MIRRNVCIFPYKFHLLKTWTHIKKKRAQKTFAFYFALTAQYRTLQEDVNKTVLGGHENQRHFEEEGTNGKIGSQMECLIMTHNLGLKGFKVM